MLLCIGLRSEWDSACQRLIVLKVHHMHYAYKHPLKKMQSPQQDLTCRLLLCDFEQKQEAGLSFFVRLRVRNEISSI